MSHLEKAILKGKKFKKGELRKMAKEELKEHKGRAIKKAMSKC